MWNKPTQEQLGEVPGLYQTENVDLEDKIIAMHFFIGGCDWYAAEYDGEDIFFGFVNLNDPQNAEWGNFSLQELAAININGLEVDHDLFWEPKKVSKIENIK